MPLECLFIQLEEIDSTHEFVLRHLHYLDKDRLTFVTARTQSKGRGKGDRSWISCPGNIHLSIYYQLKEEHPLLHELSHLLAYSVYEAVSSTEHPLFFKEPNDLFYLGKKCCGVLTSIDLPHLVMSVGCNLASTPSPLFSCLSHISHATFMEQFKQKFLNHFTSFLNKEWSWPLCLSKLEGSGVHDDLNVWKNPLT